MDHDVFTIERVSTSEQLFCYVARINVSHAVFDGHFPKTPVVPGVCTMNMLKQCLSDALSRPVRYDYIQECKFLVAILPEHKQLDVRILVKEDGELINITAEVILGELKMMKLKATLMISTKQNVEADKVLVVLPTYNNAGTLARVVEDVRQYSSRVLVVNDGSTDQTQSVLDELEVSHLSYFPNKGKGYAIRQAFRYALEQGYDYVITMDSDGQHDAADLKEMINAMEASPNSLIIGARNLRADRMPQKNTFANKFSNFWYLVETGIKLEDTQSGFRLYPIRKMNGIRFFSNRYEFEVEVIVRAAWKGIPVCNIPIQVYYPPQDERISHFRPLKDFTRISILNSFLVIIAFLFYYPWRFISSLTKENILRFIRENITETKDSNHRVAASIGLGIFFGIVPVWGYQMIVAGITAHFLKLNKILTIISSNISIPPMIPLILYMSFYTGALLLGTDVSLSVSAITLTDVYSDLFQYIYGAMVFAVTCGVLAYIITFGSLLFLRRAKNG